MKKIIFYILILYGNHCLFSQNARLGASAEALSGASLFVQDAFAVANNPAMTTEIKAFEGGLTSKRKFLLALPEHAVVAVLPSKYGAFGGQYTYLGMDDYNEQSLSFSYAKQLFSGFNAALKFGGLWNHFTENYASGMALNMEAAFTLRLRKDCFLAAHILNPVQMHSTEVAFAQLRPQIRLGTQYILSEQLCISAEIGDEITKPWCVAVGAEYEWKERFLLRCGMSSYPLSYSAGIGCEINAFRVDVATVYTQYLGFTPQLSLVFFNKHKNKQ